MKSLNDFINEKTYYKLEIIDSHIDDMIVEIAVSLKDYHKRVDGLRFQIVENWCLCKYCQLYDKENMNFSHWAKELRACINNLKMLNIKNDIDKGNVLTKMLIDDYDYNTFEMIIRIIKDKFIAERITDSKIYQDVSIAFAEGINDLIDNINSDNSTDEYIKTTFELEKI